MTPAYDVYALRYAMRAQHFIGGDSHDAPMPMDYFVWAAVGGGKTWIIDTGFTAEVAARRKRTYLRCAIESLPLLGIDPDTVEDVIISHLHYDHVGSFRKFAKARFRSGSGISAACLPFRVIKLALRHTLFLNRQLSLPVSTMSQ
jgi:glyoxylase-like metal-dependent hydrolase (beta-lactamase superfamily II)